MTNQGVASGIVVGGFVTTDSGDNFDTDLLERNVA